MELIYIDIIRTQIIQGSMNILPKAFRIHGSCLRGNDHFLPHTVKGFSHLFLAVRVKARRVIEGHSMFVSLPQKLHCLFSGNPLYGQRPERIFLRCNFSPA